MKKYFSLLVAALAVFAFALPVYAEKTPAATDETSKVEAATAVLNEVMNIPEAGIPATLLKNANGVAVFPGVMKAAIGIGAQYGEGVLVVKTGEGGWSDPSFASLMGGSIGGQVGAESKDLILVFKNQKSIEAISRGKFTLGVDASIAAGPVGRTAEAGTDTQLSAEIYSYSRSRGLFAGVALEGASLQIDHEANVAFYNRPDITPSMIFAGKGLIAPKVAEKFMCTLASYTNTSMKRCG